MFNATFAKLSTKGIFPIKPFDKLTIIDFKLLSVNIYTSFRCIVKPEWIRDSDVPTDSLEFVESLNKQIRNKLSSIELHVAYKESLLKANIVKIIVVKDDSLLLQLECCN